MTVYQAIGLFVGITVFAVFQAMFWSVRRKKASREAALQERLRGSEYRFGDEVGLRGGGSSWAEKSELMQRLAAALAQAGIAMPVGRFVLIVGGVMLALLLLVTLATSNLSSGLVIDVMFFIVVYVFVSGKRRKRLVAIDEQLPQALELMTFSLRAGHTLEEAVNFVSNELPDPLGGELRRCYEEYEMGRPLQLSLVNLSLRLAPCRALRTFVEAVLILKQTGGNLVEIMENLIGTLRSQAAYEARHRALTSEGRTSGMILGSLPLLILAVVMLAQPGYVGSLFTTADGRWILLLALGLWGLGVAWLFRLVRPAT